MEIPVKRGLATGMTTLIKVAKKNRGFFRTKKKIFR